MKKEVRQILWIAMFFMIGCVIGYFVALTQENQLNDSAYITFWTSQNLPPPEPIGFAKSMVSFAFLFSGIPTGLMFFQSIANKWLTYSAPKILIGFITWPIYTLAGTIGFIPFIIYKIAVLLKNRV